jgi:tRNA pseudouridine32 synthase/23S rRNA pseudouridine746 synthase
MVIAKRPSKLSLPQTNPGVATVLEYLIIKFPYIDAQIWRQRIADGKVHCHDGSLITTQSLFQPQQRIYYYREVESEPIIPFKETILFQDEHILVAYKPHFLAVIPGGICVNECLQNRLRRSTGIEALQALHRLDRVTAGLVIFSVNPDTCHRYHHLFETRQTHKTYQAIAKINDGENLIGQEWEVKNRLVQCEPQFRMRVTEGEANIDWARGRNWQGEEQLTEVRSGQCGQIGRGFGMIRLESSGSDCTMGAGFRENSVYSTYTLGAGQELCELIDGR